MVAATLTKKVLEDRRDRERERRASHGGLPRREAGWCLGIDVGTSEEGALWLALLHWLGAGSRGWVELVASDARLSVIIFLATCPSLCSVSSE